MAETKGRLNIPVEDELRAAVDDWRRAQSEIPARGTAARLLIWEAINNWRAQTMDKPQSAKVRPEDCH